MSRKTIHVRRVLEVANNYLACPHLTPENKQGVYQLLQRVLHETDNYAGFGYQNLTDDHRPCLLDSDGAYAGRNPEWSEKDENSRYYYLSPNLRERNER